MRISAKAEYACLALIALAKPRLDDAPLRIREIADAHEIPERYLVQILLQLKASGLVHSTRGSIGGYRLARGAEEISVADVITAIDGPGEPPRKHGSPSARDLSEVIEHASAAQRDVLSQTTIADFAARTVQHDYVL